MLLRKTLYILFLILSLPILGQESNHVVEYELREKIKNATNDSIKIHYLFELTKIVEKSNLEAGRQLMQEVLQIVDTTPNPSTHLFSKKAQTLDVLGKYESRQSNYENSYKLRLEALKIRERIADSFGIAQSYHSIGMLFRYQKEYEKSKQYFLKSLAIQENVVDSSQKARTYNMLGVIYYYNKQNDSAIFCYNKSKNLYPTLANKVKPKGNLAILYYNNGDYDSAIKIFKENFELFKTSKNYNEMSIILTHLAKIHSDLGKHQKAISYMDEAFDYYKKLGNSAQLPLMHQLNSHIYEKKGDYKNALESYKTHKFYYDSIYNVNNAKKITALELNHEFQKEKLADSLKFTSEKQELELKSQTTQARNRLYLALLLLVSAGIVILLVIIRNRKKLNQERLKKEQLENDLLAEKLKLQTFQTKQLVADNKMRLQFKEEFLSKLKKVKQHPNAIDVSSFQSLISDLTVQINTENKFDSIRDNIEELDQSFNKKLETLYPDLTKSEREICALLRMNLSLKEIIIIRNVSMGSIKSSRHRIRKKMGLERNQELDQFIQNLFLDT